MQNESEQKLWEIHVKKMRMSRWLGALCLVAQVLNLVVARIKGVSPMEDGIGMALLLGLLVCWLFDEQNERADKIEAKLDALKTQLDEMPFEVRRKLYLKQGESYWPEMDIVVSPVRPVAAPPEEKEDQK